MADYIYLLENRLSPSQQLALQQVREVSRSHGMNVFLTGGAVRDLTSGSPVRDLDVSIQGNALKLKKEIQQTGGELSGEHEPSQTLFFRFRGGVRVEVSSTRTETYPQPGKPVYHPADLKQDLYRRDFTANAMALSLNEGSYGLLIDPMNGVADIESRYLRLVSNYGFIEDPTRLVRAARLSARLGWQMDEKTQARYQTGKDENFISALGDYSRGYELEEIVHEEDPLKVLKALEAEGWMKALFPAWTTAKANIPGLQALHDTLMQMQMQGMSPDASAASFVLLTGKLAPRDVQALKDLFPRQGFVAEIEGLDAAAKEFAKLLLGKEATSPSATWKLMTSHPAEAVLWLAHTSKNAAVQAKFHDFFVVWPEARQKYPYLLMQEMRITPELPRYQELLQTLFFEMMDGNLQTPEEMKSFLEPYSPPAPPPPIHLRRPRTVKKADGKKPRKKAAEKTEGLPPEAEERGAIGGGESPTPELEGAAGTPAGEDIAAAKPARVAKVKAAGREAQSAVASKVESKAEPARGTKVPVAAIKKPLKTVDRGMEQASAGTRTAAAAKTSTSAKAAAKPAAEKGQSGTVSAKPPAKRTSPSAGKTSAGASAKKTAAVVKKSTVQGARGAKHSPSKKTASQSGKAGAKALRVSAGTKTAVKPGGSKPSAAKAVAPKSAAAGSAKAVAAKGHRKASGSPTKSVGLAKSAKPPRKTKPQTGRDSGKAGTRPPAKKGR